MEDCFGQTYCSVGDGMSLWVDQGSTIGSVTVVALSVGDGVIATVGGCSLALATRSEVDKWLARSGSASLVGVGNVCGHRHVGFGSRAELAGGVGVFLDVGRGVHLGSALRVVLERMGEEAVEEEVLASCWCEMSVKKERAER